MRWTMQVHLEKALFPDYQFLFPMLLRLCHTINTVVKRHQINNHIWAEERQILLCEHFCRENIDCRDCQKIVGLDLSNMYIVTVLVWSLRSNNQLHQMDRNLHSQYCVPLVESVSKRDTSTIISFRKAWLRFGLHQLIFNINNDSQSCLKMRWSMEMINYRSLTVNYPLEYASIFQNHYTKSLQQWMAWVRYLGKTVA